MNWENINSGKCPSCGAIMIEGSNPDYKCPKCLSEYELICYAPRDIAWTQTKKPQLKS